MIEMRGRSLHCSKTSGSDSILDRDKANQKCFLKSSARIARQTAILAENEEKLSKSTVGSKKDVQRNMLITAEGLGKRTSKWQSHL